MNDEQRKAMYAKKNGSAIILVGVSGSGKSTLAKKQYPNAVICSTDTVSYTHLTLPTSDLV